MNEVVEKAVRDYLEYVVSPDRVPPELAALEQQIEAETDPIRKAVLHQMRIDVRDGEPQKEQFIGHALAWTQQTGVSARVLHEMGVDTSVLTAAGFNIGNLKAAGRRSNERVNADIERYVRGTRRGTKLTTRDVADATGVHHKTARRALYRLVGDALSEPVKELPRSGQGRTNMVFTRI